MSCGSESNLFAENSACVIEKENIRTKIEIPNITLSTTLEIAFDTETTIVQTEKTVQVDCQPEPSELIYLENNHDLNSDEVSLLAKLINKESSANYMGKLAVGSCVVNRMRINKLTMEEVIFEPNQFVTAWYLDSYSDEDYRAAQEILSCGVVDDRIYYFDGGYDDCLNRFYDINNEYIGAY